MAQREIPLLDRTNGGVEWPATKPRWFIAAHWVDVGGRPECVGVEFWRGCRPASNGNVASIGSGPAGITSTDLRTVPLAALLRDLWRLQRQAAVAQAKSKMRYGRDRMKDLAATGTTPESAIEDEQVEWFFDGAWDDILVSRKTRSTRDDGHLAEVARVYGSALAERRPPTAAVAEHFHVSHSAAAKWARKARVEGLLAPTTQGLASPSPAVVKPRRKPSKGGRK